MGSQINALMNSVLCVMLSHAFLFTRLQNLRRSGFFENRELRLKFLTSARCLPVIKILKSRTFPINATVLRCYNIMQITTDKWVRRDRFNSGQSVSGGISNASTVGDSYNVFFFFFLSFYDIDLKLEMADLRKVHAQR